MLHTDRWIMRNYNTQHPTSTLMPNNRKRYKGNCLTCFAVLQGPESGRSTYLAASTKQHMLLFDSRHFNAPVLCWAHRMDTEPPQLLAFALSSTFIGTLSDPLARSSTFSAESSCLQTSYRFFLHKTRYSLEIGLCIGVFCNI